MYEHVGPTVIGRYERESLSAWNHVTMPRAICFLPRCYVPAGPHDRRGERYHGRAAHEAAHLAALGRGLRGDHDAGRVHRIAGTRASEAVRVLPPFAMVTKL